MRVPQQFRPSYLCALKTYNNIEMKNFRFFTTGLALLIVCSAAQAQFSNRLNNAVRNAAENAAVRQAEKRTEEAVNKAIDNAFDNNNQQSDAGGNNQQSDAGGDNQQSATSGNNSQPAAQPVTVGNNNQQSAASSASAAVQTPQQGGNTLEMAYAKNDFVPGDEIFFEDLMDNEQLGEFPALWDLNHGTAEIATINGKKAIVNSDKRAYYSIMPLMKNMKNYLPEKFTLEMDLWMSKLVAADEEAMNKLSYSYSLYFFDETEREIAHFSINNFSVDYIENPGQVKMSWNYLSTSDAWISGDATTTINANGWHHLSISFNLRAFKVYLDGTRYANIPNMAQPANFRLNDDNINQSHWGSAVTNVRIAKGTVPLYDRMLTDGKFITYGITFDVGKSTIKPESMGEINRIAQLMTANPDLKFSVEGHTDSTGSAAANQTLSEARSQAVVDKLVANGIARNRLQAAGKGQTSPIADNGTDEGRAKNRRVEFVKL